ncbi:MAG: energy-coupling factor transporter ATPase [Andreesenia angusta]|nr:energy-coupling factor transporter ATPase [Andreesenia angusta]
MSIEIRDLVHIYSEGTPFEKRALDGVNLKIEKGKFIGLIGHTGSGKSTLIQHINGLIKPNSGEILINGLNITKKEIKMREVRQKVGLVFQYPEHQLFEETVEKDISFGPMNLGLKEDIIKERVKDSMEKVGLDYLEYKDRSPFELSGGQKRRVAIAGVIAMNPEVLILDEPTAGLDPKGREDILGQIKILNDNNPDLTIILVSHSMEDIANLVDKIIVMNGGKVELYGTPREIFKNIELLERVGLAAPQVTYVMKALKNKYPDIDTEIYTVEQARDEILRVKRGQENA